MIEFSKPNSPAALKVGSGEMDLQDTTVFNSGGLTGTYSFNFAGVTSAAIPQSEVGDFTSKDGTISAGNVGNPATTPPTPPSPGRIDINNGVPQTTQAFGPSTYSISANGRGMATIGSSTFNFYLISSSRAKFIETDTSAILVGDAFRQQTSLCSWGKNALNGAIVFETGGTKSAAGITDLVSFTADGIGGATGESIDENSGGIISPPASSLGGSYGIDVCGRGTLSIPAGAPNRTYVFYMISVGNALIQEVTSGVVAHGTLVQPQAGPFTAASLNGSYALNLAGTNAASTTTGNELDLVGQLTTSGTTPNANGNVTSGSVDINNDVGNLGKTQTGGTEVGTYTIIDPTNTDAAKGRATMTLTSPQNLVLYIVSPTQVFAMVGNDNTSVVAIGSLYKQF
jgi:hypothetical protein